MSDELEADGRRLARLQIAPEILLCLGSGRFEVIAHPLPADARLVHTFVDGETDTINVVFESQSLPPVALGDTIPTHEPPPVIKKL